MEIANMTPTQDRQSAFDTQTNAANSSKGEDMENEKQESSSAQAMFLAKQLPTLNVIRTIKALRLKVSRRDKSLYVILADAYKLYLEINTANDSAKKQYIKDMKSLQKKLCGSQCSSVVHTAIIRLVFDGSDMERQRVSTYASVIKNAGEADVMPEDFSEWLQDAGGIDKVSRLNSKSTAEIIDIDSALDDLEYIDEMAVLAVSGLGQQVKNNNFEFKLAFCKWDSATGQLSIFKLIEDEEKVKSAFRPFAKEVSATALKKVKGQALLDKITGKTSAVDAALGDLS